MTGFDYILRAIDIYEESLRGGEAGSRPRTVEALARRIGYSTHHFTHLFSAIVGMSPREYMAGRLLSAMAREIVGTDVPLASLAAAYGFEDYETFSRAFKRRFGIPPRAARESGRIDFALTERPSPARPRGELPLDSAEPEIVCDPGHFLVGLPFFMEEGTQSFHKPWETFAKARRLVRGAGADAATFQFSSWSDDESLGGISILCALEADPSVPQEAIFTARPVPPARCLRFVHRGDPSTFFEAYRYIYRDWFGRNDVTPAASWEFQRYGEGGDPGATGIYIPIALS